MAPANSFLNGNSVEHTSLEKQINTDFNVPDC
jgi:hypothetical protein